MIINDYLKNDGKTGFDRKCDSYNWVDSLLLLILSNAN